MNVGSMWEPLFLSLKVAFVSTLFAALLGIGAGRLMVRKQFRGKAVWDTLFLMPMVLPPSVVGFFLLVLVGRQGQLGNVLWEKWGISLIFSWQGAVLAAGVVAFPLVYQAARNAFSRADGEWEDAARTDGASEWQVFLRITVPLQAPALLAGVLLGFARSLGEFGATLMVAGNIPGVTQTAPIAVYFALEAGDRQTAWLLSLGMAGISYLCVLIHQLLLRRQDKS
jgi:molybdate transport system permease protein